DERGGRCQHGGRRLRKRCGRVGGVVGGLVVDCGPHRAGQVGAVNAVVVFSVDHDVLVGPLVAGALVTAEPAGCDDAAGAANCPGVGVAVGGAGLGEGVGLVVERDVPART